MNINDFEKDLKRRKGQRFTDNQLELADKLYESGYTLEVISYYLNTDKSNLGKALNKYRFKTSGNADISDSEVLCVGGGPWYFQSAYYSGKPVNKMGRL